MHKLSDAELDAQISFNDDDVDFLKSMVFQGSDMTDRQERRLRRIIDELRMFAVALRDSRKSESTHGAHRIAKAVQGKGSV